MEKYILVEVVEREIFVLNVTDSWQDAFNKMVKELVNAFGEVPEDLPENIAEFVQSDRYEEEDLGIGKYDAWLNKKDNFDWKIFKLSVNGTKVNIE